MNWMRLQLLKLKDKHRHSQDSGYTMIELMAVIVIIGILAAIAAPSWLSFVRQQRVNKVNDAVFQAMKEAQSEAKKSKLNYNVSFKTDDKDIPVVAVYPDNLSPLDQGNPRWDSLGEELEIKEGNVLFESNISKDTPNQVGNSNFKQNDIVTITFDKLGALNTDGAAQPDLGGDQDNPQGLIVRVGAPDDTNNSILSTQRCVKIMTLIGGTQIGKDQECEF